MNEILQALETLTANNCMTIAEALDKAYLAGHREAVKKLEPTQLVVMNGGGNNATSTGSFTSKQ